MGLLSRLGNQFATDMPMRSMGQDALKGMSYGTVGGALAGAMDGPEGLHPGIGMMGGAAAGTALGAAGGLRHVVMSIARALKQQHPQVPDEMIMQEAQKRAQTLGGHQLQDVYQRNFGEQLSPDLADFHARNRQQ